MSGDDQAAESPPERAVPLPADEHADEPAEEPGTQPLVSDMTSTLSLGTPEVEPEVAAVDPDRAALESLPEGSALLVVRRGPNAGSRFVLDVDLVTAGRHPDSDIFLDDITVSRRHAEFLRDGGSYRVRDVGSLNGTYVNRERTDDAVLAHGDEVQIGKFKLVFFSGGEA